MAKTNNLRLLHSPPSIDYQNGIVVYEQDSAPEGALLTIAVGSARRSARFEGRQAWFLLGRPIGFHEMICPVKLQKSAPPKDAL